MNRHPATLAVFLTVLTFGASPVRAQANDPCSGAITVQMGTLVSGNTVGATTATPAGGCNITNDVWYKFVAPYTGLAEIATCSSHGGSATFDTVINVWSFAFCSSPGSPIACNDDSCGGLQSYVS